MNEKMLLGRIVAGDKEAFRVFYDQTRGALGVMVAKKVGVGQDVEEIVQDTYLAFLDSLPLFEGKSSLKTFLWAIARHEVADYWRKKYAKKAIRTVPFVDQVYREELYSAAETAVVIQQVYGKLSVAEQKLLRLKYEQGLSVKEIAAELKISVKAAESKLFRARKAFQLAYESSK